MTKKLIGVAAIVACLGLGVAAWAAQRPASGPHAAAVGPHPQANLPALELPGYQLARPPEVIRSVYRFAAEHPEVLNYMPCYCGCEHEGHRSNEDCFVKARAKNGDVTAWNDHGMVCAMCLAVGEQAMRMHATGASLGDIGAEVERKFGHITENRTPTPPPPRHTARTKKK